MRPYRYQRAYNVRYYAANREREIARVTRRAIAHTQLLRELKRLPCADCEEAFPSEAMDFDHRDPSKKSFEVMKRAGGVSLARLLAEVEKCDVVCANCHRIRTYSAVLDGQMQKPGFIRSEGPAATPQLQRMRDLWNQRVREHLAFLDRVRELPCADCRRRFPPYVMEFDHRIPDQKLFSIHMMPGRMKFATILEEIAKCDIVCSNCHRIRTKLRRTEARGSSTVVSAPAFQAGYEGSIPFSRSAAEPRLIEESATRYIFTAA